MIFIIIFDNLLIIHTVNISSESFYIYPNPSHDNFTLRLSENNLPLSVTMTTNKIYDAFYADYNQQTAFLHSHSYTGNPLACSAALATLEIFESDDVLVARMQSGATIFSSSAKS